MVDEVVPSTPQEVSVVIPPSVPERTPRMIILFDGVCNVCHSFVSFIYPRDLEKRFYFQAMQSKKGREILASWGIPHNLNTVVLVDEANNKYYTKSTAIFNILKDLSKPWAYMYYLIYLPRFLRDFGYSSFSSARYMLFGKKTECAFFPGLKDRFIDWRSPIVEIEDGSKDM